MAELVREHDWSRTELGPLNCWPEALVAAVNLMLESPIPSTLYWGPGLAMIYNDGYRQFMGQRHPEGLGQPLSVVWPEAWPVIRQTFQGVWATGLPVQNDEFLVPIEVDGAMEDFYWSYSLSPVYDGGRILALYNTCVDVTAGVVMARERDELAQRLERVLSSTSDGVVTLNRTWRVTYINEAASRKLAAVPEMVGRDVWKDLGALGPGRSGQGGAGSEHKAHFVRAMEEGVPAEFESYYPEPLKLWFWIRVSPTPEGLAVFFQDITEEKQAREAAAKAVEALARSEEELRWTVALSAQMPWAADANGGILKIDDFSQMVGERSVPPTTGDGWKQMVHPDDVETSAEVWSHSIRTGVPYDREHRLMTRDGTYRWFRSRARPRQDEAGRIVKWYGTNEDIDHRKHAEESLRTSEKLAAVGRLASSIAHEINNPLEAVTNLVFLARTSENVTEEVQEYLETAERELKRATTITSQTLRFHRQSSKQTEVKLCALMDEVLNLLHGRLVNSLVETEIRTRTARTIRCFEGEIRQVFLNLVVNAADAMHGCGGGRLLVRIREATDWRTRRTGVAVTVADTGPGMTAEVREQIFDPFFTTKGAAGTGLGLWVSQEIVARHLGVLRLRTRPAAEDREGGCGCVFTLFLPEDAVERPKRRRGDVS